MSLYRQIAQMFRTRNIFRMNQMGINVSRAKHCWVGTEQQVGLVTSEKCVSIPRTRQGEWHG